MVDARSTHDDVTVDDDDDDVTLIRRHVRTQHQVLRGRRLGAAEGSDLPVRKLCLRVLHRGGDGHGGDDGAEAEGL